MYSATARADTEIRVADKNCIIDNMNGQFQKGLPILAIEPAKNGTDIGGANAMESKLEENGQNSLMLILLKQMIC